jgi:protein SCO1/2
LTPSPRLRPGLDKWHPCGFRPVSASDVVRPAPPRRRLLVALGSAVVALALAGCDRFGSAAFKAIDITGADYARELTLPDIEGRQRTLAEFKGKVVVVFFGFTHCPDVCPTTLVELAAIKRALGPDGDRVQGIFVTVDPERDTAEVLRAYVTNFDPGFIALRGTLQETQAMAKQFKVFYAKVPGKTADTYTIDHTAGSYVFDPQGRIRLFTRHGTGSDALVHDLKILLEGR